MHCGDATAVWSPQRTLTHTHVRSQARARVYRCSAHAQPHTCVLACTRMSTRRQALHTRVHTRTYTLTHLHAHAVSTHTLTGMHTPQSSHPWPSPAAGEITQPRGSLSGHCAWNGKPATFRGFVLGREATVGGGHRGTGVLGSRQTLLSVGAQQQSLAFQGKHTMGPARLFSIRVYI